MESIAVKKIYFERALFISWYCSLGDCTYCYMSTQKHLIEDPEKAKRSNASILAEAFICKKLGWKIGPLSAGYGSYTHESIRQLCKDVFEVTKEKFWLNIGVLPDRTIEACTPYLDGIYGAVETVNETVHKQVAPNKPIAPIEKMFARCEKFNLKKAMTFIVGMGETIDDFSLLESFIKRNNIDKIVFYALNPIKGTVFEGKTGPSISYYNEWIKKTRTAFPDLDIVCGPWVNQIEHIQEMLEGGANALTKFPAIKLFNSKFSTSIETGIQNAGYEMEGSFTKLPDIDVNEIDAFDLDLDTKQLMKRKVKEYLAVMRKNTS